MSVVYLIVSSHTYETLQTSQQLSAIATNPFSKHRGKKLKIQKRQELELSIFMTKQTVIIMYCRIAAEAGVVQRAMSFMAVCGTGSGVETRP
jgi:hypothetical protein